MPSENKEDEMFGKSIDKNGKSKDHSRDHDLVPPVVKQFQELAAMSEERASTDENKQASHPVRLLQRSAAMSQESASAEQISSIGRGLTIIGKIFGESTVHIFGRLEGEIQALAVLISEGAQVDGDVVAEELTIAGQLKGTIHANRVKLNSTAVVEGDIFHHSLSIEENARFEGSSKREDKAVDVPRTPLTRPATQNQLQANVTTIEGKSNGAPNHDGHSNPGTSQ
jgi:cytoskeletal protein CcmA (bactofilin family)